MYVEIRTQLERVLIEYRKVLSRVFPVTRAQISRLRKGAHATQRYVR